MNIVMKNTLVMFLLTVFLLFSSLGMNLSPLLVSPLIIVILLVYPNKFSIIKIVGFIYALFFLFLIKINAILFDFIPQAEVLLEKNQSVFYWFSVGHVHAIRLLLAYPAYLISKIYNVDLDLGFTYYGLILFIFIFLNISNTISRLQIYRSRLPKGIKYIILLLPLLILPLIMNGRLVLSYLGYAILIDLYTNLILKNKVEKVKAILITICGLTMTMVSSGTMAVAFFYTMVMLYVINFTNFNKKKFIKTIIIFLIILSPLIYKVIGYMWIMISRNINFFGGGIKGVSNMLHHGLGIYFNLSNKNIYILFIVAIIILIFNCKYLKNKMIKNNRLISILVAINIAVYGLLFGFSTGLMVIPPLLIYILTRI